MAGPELIRKINNPLEQIVHNAFMKLWLALPILLLVACAPQNYLTDPAYLSAWAQTPELKVACVNEDNRPSPNLSFGANTCSVAVQPTEARDVQRLEYTVTINYRTKTGTLIRPKTENRTKEIKGESPMGFAQTGTASFPMYIPNTNFWEQSGHLLAGTFKLVISLAPAALGNYLGVPIPAVNLDANKEGLFKDVDTAIHDLIENKDEPYAVEVSARMCGPQLCSPFATKTLSLP